MIHKKRFTPIFFFLLLNFFAYSQVSNSETEKISFYDLDFEKRANDGSDTLFMLLYNFDANDSKKKLTYDCLPNYSIEIINVSVVTYNGPSNKYYLTRKSDNKTEDYTRSIFFIFTSSPKVQKVIDDNLFKLSLERYQSRNGVVTYKITKIDNQDVFCWKLSQAIKFFESNKELFKEEENSSEKVEEKPKFSINLSSTALLSGNLKPSTGPYGNQLGFTQQPIRFDIDFQYWIKKFRLGLGLGFSQFYCNNSLNDSSYQIPWANSLLGNNNHLNIYYKNIKEKVQFQNYNFSFNLGYSEPLFKNRLRWDVDAGFQFILPFVVQSQLIQGEFSYRGQIDGIVDELRDIPVLGLVENNLTSRGKISTFQMNGWGLTLETGLAYNFKNFECKVGIGYNFIHYTNDNYLEKSIISQIAEDFKSPLFSVQSITSHYFMLQFGLGYSIK